ncbi:SDR family oxidoreductase [Acetobacter sp.]|jgi:nucleoside-diphosphate-sugar epimerase|uniref:SDR family oxidoreductase n=1 Tax=Acetobacter sp. TaxID=440 RepID=UPI0025B98FB7|nr:NAD-dependent epimerase/dehydratase family protein [Acetobacter sp.]MCH4091974.1 NAD-dependent epimerase/dehydratase family protein [Acetobacter sp.]MCI1301106.1 NAD-dependent epimerase/dehydratase family protein [Acetobacter sp.]MCI1317299.1 NAD-dependent epimerase/dehydratase family protein [Acetobacter sp.]
MPFSASEVIIAVIGASGRSGSVLCHSLLSEGYKVIAVVRNRHNLAPELATVCYAVREADLTDRDRLSAALKDALIVVNTAHARYLSSILAVTPAPVVALGSTRKFTRWPDAHGNGVLAGERALKEDGRPSILLHPTMIYGAQGENNVQRLAALLRKLPVVPLPGRGRFLVQPIEQRDVTRCVVAAIPLILSDVIKTPETLVIAGPEAITYRKFVSMIAHFSENRKIRIISVPDWCIRMAACILRKLPGVPRIEDAEIRRLTEDKDFDITAMKEKLGVTPMALSEGLAKIFAK